RPRNTLSHGVHLCPPEGIQATDIFPKTSSKLHEKEDTRDGIVHQFESHTGKWIRWTSCSDLRQTCRYDEAKNC
ncbi:MAG: hypothetical protein LBE62_15285, partial [Azonexus sp.]|nr:hypothetical protein [Azonexus sp.]